VDGFAVAHLRRTPGFDIDVTEEIAERLGPERQVTWSAQGPLSPATTAAIIDPPRPHSSGGKNTTSLQRSNGIVWPVFVWLP
jgi:hypothetical protein